MHPLIASAIHWLEKLMGYEPVGSLEAMEAVDRALAFADVVALAAWADGQVTNQELQTLAALLSRDEKPLIGPMEALTRWQNLAKKLESTKELKEFLQYARSRLAGEDAAEALRMVEAMAAQGAALLDRTQVDYRTTYRASSEALLELFREELMKPDAE